MKTNDGPLYIALLFALAGGCGSGSPSQIPDGGIGDRVPEDHLDKIEVELVDVVSDELNSAERPDGSVDGSDGSADAHDQVDLSSNDATLDGSDGSADAGDQADAGESCTEIAADMTWHCPPLGLAILMA